MKENIRKYIKDNFFDDNFKDSDSLQDNGIVDSTGFLEIILYLEEEYKIDIKDDEMIPENLDSIDNIVRFLDGKV